MVYYTVPTFMDFEGKQYGLERACKDKSTAEAFKLSLKQKMGNKISVRIKEIELINGKKFAVYVK